MTKLEEKLKELGYEIKPFEEDIKDNENDFIAIKKVNFDGDIVIGIWDNKIQHYYLYTFTEQIRRQDTIDNLQQAYNIMQQDLEELKQCQVK